MSRIFLTFLFVFALEMTVNSANAAMKFDDDPLRILKILINQPCEGASEVILEIMPVACDFHFD
jgi:hypothetical protein